MTEQQEPRIVITQSQLERFMGRPPRRRWKIVTELVFGLLVAISGASAITSSVDLKQAVLIASPLYVVFGLVVMIVGTEMVSKAWKQL